MADTHQKNIRVSDETASKFLSFCEDNNISQAKAFEILVDGIEMDKAKQDLQTRRTEIEEMDLHLRKIREGYLSSLELAKDTEARVRVEFESSLVSKDRTIASLQKEVSDLKDKLSAAAESEKTARREAADAAERARKEQEKAESAEKAIKAMESESEAQKSIVVMQLNRRIAEMQEKVEAFDSMKEQLAKAEISSQNAEFQAKVLAEQVANLNGVIAALSGRKDAMEDIRENV